MMGIKYVTFENKKASTLKVAVKNRPVEQEQVTTKKKTTTKKKE